jgi:putative DNA primase/helicase
VTKAVDDEVAIVAASTNGTRHDTLRTASMRLASLVNAGALEAGRYRSALHGAADSVFLPGEAGEVSDLIESALGKAEPRDLSGIGQKTTEAGEPDWDAVGEEAAEEMAKEKGQDRPAIEVNTERHIVVEQAIEALSGDPDLYCRGGILVTVVVDHDPIATLHGGVELRNAQGSPRVVTLAESVVGCHLTKIATYYQWKKTKDGESIAIDCHPPTWLIRAVTDKGHWPGIRPLLSIAECPFIRGDGSIVESPGYDPATGCLYRPAIDFPTVPAAPTKADAEAAAERLLDVVKQFPFASKDDRAVWLGGLLSAAARPAIAGPVPGIAIVGNKAGCGKGLLIDVIGILMRGGNVPTSCYPTEPEEAQKVKVAIGLAGKSIVHFDNLEEGASYGNPALDSALTSTEIEDRILGTSKTTGRLPLRVSWFLSGNNVSPSKDAYRRWLPCNIATDLERPEERDDIQVGDLRGYVGSRRGDLVRDALTILKAHAVADFPKDKWAPLGSFENWDRIVRGAVWFATGRDCCATRRKVADEAPERLDKLALLEGWAVLPEGGKEGKGITAEDALNEVELDQKTFTALRRALIRRTRDGKLPSPRQVGTFIRGMKGSVIGGLAFQKTGEVHRSALWRVVGTVPTSPSPQPSGECGGVDESIPNPPTRDLRSDNYVNTTNETQKTRLERSGIDSSTPPHSPELEVLDL